MNVEAMWVVKYVDPSAPGSGMNLAGGVIVLETGRLFGGDSGAYYVGSYKVKDGAFAFEAHVRFHDPNFSSALGLRDYWLEGSGHIEPDMQTIPFRGVARGHPQLQLNGALFRIAELP
jgi:hypothetical protein